MVLPGHTCSTLAPHVRQVRSIAKGIMASTEGTKVSSEGVKVHLKEYKKQCDNVAALAKFPGVLGTPMEAVRMCHDKLVDAALAGLRKEHTPTFEIAGLSAGPSKAEVLEGGRQRKQAGGGSHDGRTGLRSGGQASGRAGLCTGEHPARADRRIGV